MRKGETWYRFNKSESTFAGNRIHLLLFLLVLSYSHQFIFEIFNASYYNYELKCEWAQNKMNAFLITFQDWRGRHILKRGSKVQFCVWEDRINTIAVPIIQCRIVGSRYQLKEYNVQGAYIPDCQVEEAYKASLVLYSTCSIAAPVSHSVSEHIQNDMRQLSVDFTSEAKK